MKRLFSARPLIAAAVALGALVAGSAAQARTDVVFSIGLNAPYGYVQPAPVYVQPQSVYYQPQPVYYQPQPTYYAPEPVYYQSQSVYAQPRVVYYRYGHNHRYGHRHGGWDRDHDGVPDRYDREPNNPYRH